MNSKNNVAILVLAHKKPEQINALIKALKHPNIDVFLHIDKKSKIDIEKIEKKENLYILEDDLRISVSWGQISQLDATLNLIKKAQAIKRYSYYILISGEDFPCKSIDKIYQLANTQKNKISFWESQNNGTCFNNFDKRCSIYFPQWMITQKQLGRLFRKLWVVITGGYGRTFKIFRRKSSNNIKFYHGPSWWGLNSETIEFILNYMDENPSFYKYFKNCSNPDESFFQTAVMLSPYADLHTSFLTYVYFLEGKNSPEILTENDCKKAIESECCFMRKIDFNQVGLNYLQELILEDK